MGSVYVCGVGCVLDHRIWFICFLHSHPGLSEKKKKEKKEDFSTYSVYILPLLYFPSVPEKGEHGYDPSTAEECLFLALEACLIRPL